MSEWGNPIQLKTGLPGPQGQGSKPAEVKHFSKRRKKKINIYSPSSGERKGKSPNHSFVPHCVRHELKFKDQKSKFKI